MKYYTITVNGNTYEVSVEEGIGSTQAAAPVSPSVAPQPVAVAKPAAPAPKAPATPAAPAKPAASATSAGSIKISSPMPGKILALKANVGQAVKKGDVVLILEAMKMENEIVSPQDGTIASINVTVGQTVEAGNLLITLN
jgi:biotin carboxyl carrier protein